MILCEVGWSFVGVDKDQHICIACIADGEYILIIGNADFRIVLFKKTKNNPHCCPSNYQTCIFIVITCAP